MSFYKDEIPNNDCGTRARDPRDAELEELRRNLDAAMVDLGKSHKEVDYWKQRCCDAEDRIAFTETRDTTELIAQNKCLKDDCERLSKEIQLYQAQLDIVYRIFPVATDRYA